MQRSMVVVAGATGRLGGLLVAKLRARGAPVRAIIRPGTSPDERTEIERLGAELAEADYADETALRRACIGGACVVSALAGLRDVIVEAQAALLRAAVAGGVPRFIPSDFAIDFYKQPDGRNRNLDLRREFARTLDAAPIRATSVLCGMFMGLLAGEAPFVLKGRKRVLYWENAHQPLDFTTVEDTAAYTAQAALDAGTPRFLRIAGDTVTARELAAAASRVTGEEFRLFRGGGLGRLDAVIRVARFVAPGRDTLYPPWQGMQYMRDMYAGEAKLEPLDNERYPMKWTKVEDLLREALA
jgi:nucleoside-diphosphate-sugar epimerase